MELLQVNAHSFMVYKMSKIYVGVARTHLLTPLGSVTKMFTVEDIDEVIRLRDEISDKVRKLHIFNQAFSLFFH